MKTNESKSLTLIKLSDNKFTDDKARLYLERIFWKDGIVCPHCR